MQAFSDPSRADDCYALPDVELWYQNGNEYVEPVEPGEELEIRPTGWYYWFCFPGCLPDSEAMGPFETQDEALADAQGGNDGS